jgi:uncharacterized protein
MSGRFSTEILDLAKQNRREERELLRSATLELLERSLAKSPIPVEEAFVFGSLVRPFSFDSRSDVDLAVHALDPRDYFSLKTYLEQELQREVDLLEIETCRFSDKIRRTGQRWTRTNI